MALTRDPITGRLRKNSNGSLSMGCCCVDCSDVQNKFYVTGEGFTGTFRTIIDPSDSDSPINFSGYNDTIAGDTAWDYLMDFIDGVGYVITDSPNPAPNTWAWYNKQLRTSDIRFHADDTVFAGYEGFTPQGTCVWNLHMEWWSTATQQTLFEGFKYTDMSTAAGRYLNNGQGSGVGQSSMSWPYIDVI